MSKQQREIELLTDRINILHSSAEKIELQIDEVVEDLKKTSRSI